MNIADALPRIAQIARRCPTATLTRAYVDAARAFCGQTRWLRETLANITTTADDPSYALVSADAGLEVIGVRQVIGTDSRGQQWELPPLDVTAKCLNTDSAQPQWYSYDPEGALVLHRTPDAAYTLTITAQVQPIRTATTIPDALDRKWSLALMAGALGYLLDLPRQPWTDHGQALKRQKEFQSAINNAKADEQRGYNTGSVRARPRLFVRPGF
jgi:YD repeat-containing protein